MMQYLVIMLDDTSVSYCHCDNPHTERRLMPLKTLKDNPGYSIDAIAKDSGFNSVRTLQRKIQEAIGLSPGQFRDITNPE